MGRWLKVDDRCWWLIWFFFVYIYLEFDFCVFVVDQCDVGDVVVISWFFFELKITLILPGCLVAPLLL